MENEENSFNWGLFIVGAIYIILALIAFSNPASGVLAIVFIFAFGAIIKGIFEIVYRKRMSRFRTINQTGLVVLGIFEILIGLLLLTNYWLGVIAIPFIFAIWFIIDSLGAIFMSSVFRNVDNALFWFTLILGILGLIIGILLLIYPVTGFLTVAFLIGIFFMIGGIVSIVEAF